MGENQHICDADQEGPVNGHTIDVEVKLDPVDGHTIDVEAKLDLSGTMEQGKIVYNNCRVLCSFIRWYSMYDLCVQ